MQTNGKWRNAQSTAAGLGVEEDELAGIVQFDQLGQKQSAEERAQHWRQQEEGSAEAPLRVRAIGASKRTFAPA